MPKKKEIKEYRKTKLGRPSKYDNPETKALILDHIRSGKSLGKIAKIENMPSVNRMSQMLWDDIEFKRGYYQAKQHAMDIFCEEIQDIADDCKSNSAPEVQKAKLQIDTRKWIASKLMPALYGEHVMIDSLIKTEVSIEDNQLQQIVNAVKGKLALEQKDIGLIEMDKEVDD